MVIAECKTEKAGWNGGFMRLQGSHAHKSSMSSSLWAFLSSLPSEDKSKATSAGPIMKCAHPGLLPNSTAKMTEVVSSFTWQQSLRTIFIC